MEGFLKRLGVFGCDRIEDMVLAGLLTGDPVLLVGTHGTAKTMMCERLARALGLNFIAYDASKALFEDVLGFPDPYSIKERNIDYVSTPISIADKEFVLIDEISRTNYQMQSKWLEVIRSRRIMGKPIQKLKYIFGAMNPPFYPGARTLDPALSGRFCFIIWFPHFDEMMNEDKKRIISNISEDDAPLLKREENQKINYEKVGKELKETLKKAEKSLYELRERISEVIDRFIINFTEILKKETPDYRIDGRRTGMIMRGILAYSAIKKVKGEFSEEKLVETILSILPSLLPYSVEKEDFENSEIESYIRLALIQAFGKKKKFKILLDPMKILSIAELELEKTENMEKKLSILEKLYQIDMEKIKDEGVKRRFYEFHREIFASLDSLSKDVISDIILTQNLPINISLEDATALRLLNLSGKDLFRGKLKFFFDDLKKAIIERKRRAIE